MVLELPEPERLFALANSAALIGWMILIILPRRFDVIFFIPQYLMPFGFALLYAGLIFANVYTVDGGFSSIADVRALFGKDELLLAGWLHYLAFDMFIGAWIARQSDAIGLPRLLQAPILVATFMFGPVGLALFLTMRSLYRRRADGAAS